MSTQQPVNDLTGKTIASAAVQPRVTGDAEFVIRFTDGSVATVAAWKREGNPLEMSVDISPNAHPTADGGSSTRRGM
jgi:hypothetical protein